MKKQKDYTQQDLPKLKAQWYKKLARAGFDDIEQPDGNLRIWSTRPASVSRESKAEYYRLAQQYVHEEVFPTKLDRRVWTLHAEGLTNEDVARAIKKSIGSVEWHIKKMRELLGLRWNNKY